MKSIYFLWFVIMVQGITVKSKKVIPAPKFTGFKAGAKVFNVTWGKVVSDDDTHRVLGYVINIWELPDDTVEKYQIIAGQKQLVKTRVPVKMDPNVIPPGEGRQVYIQGGNKTETSITDLKENVQYHMRIRTLASNSPWSAFSMAAGVRLIP